jgi:RNA polymerase sigma-70 factor (ECF subfamily)
MVRELHRFKIPLVTGPPQAYPVGMRDPPLPHADAAMERYARGEDAAFAVVFDAVAPHVHRYARRALRETSAADDIVQQTLLKMHRARGDFLPGAQVLPWAYTIARNLIRDQVRHTKSEEHLRQRAECALVPAFAAAPDAQLVAEETVASLRSSFASLPKAQRTAYLLMRGQGFTLAQAARKLGVTVTAVKLRLHRAVMRLRRDCGDRKDRP